MDDIADFPYTVRDSRSHSWRDPESLVNADEVVVEELKRDRRDMILNLFTESIR